jgi:hypothetical protein
MMSRQVDQLLGKQEKMGKVVARVKFLLEKEEGAASNSNNKGKAAANSKMEIAKVGEISTLHCTAHDYLKKCFRSWFSMDCMFLMAHL